MVSIEIFQFNPFGENTYILFDETKEAIIIDPGNYSDEETEMITNFIAENGLNVVAITNTHAHVDHVLGVAAVKRIYQVPFYLHELDEPILRSVKTYAPNYGFHQYQEPELDGYLTEEKQVQFGNTTLEVIWLPGHAPGHVGFYQKDEKFLIGGDVLFRQSIGRTDLPMGDFATLEKSIRTKLYILSDDVVVYPGHGPKTTIGFEKKNNHFVKA